MAVCSCLLMDYLADIPAMNWTCSKCAWICPQTEWSRETKGSLTNFSAFDEMAEKVSRAFRTQGFALGLPVLAQASSLQISAFSSIDFVWHHIEGLKGNHRNLHHSFYCYSCHSKVYGIRLHPSLYLFPDSKSFF